MAQHNLKVDLDELVRFVSAIWATIHNGGNLLSPGDLLRGEKIRPMARNLVDMWNSLYRDLVDYCADLDAYDLRRNEVYGSLNAAIVLGVIWSLLRRWLRLHKLNVVDSDSYSKQCDALLRARADRWLICSQWAGRWGSANDQSFAQYISDAAKAWQVIEASEDQRFALSTVAGIIDDWLKKLAPEAAEYIRVLEVDHRQFVNAYYAPIWIWLRLEEKRWQMASIPLRTEGRQNPFLHVDHIVPVKIWETMRPRPDNGLDAPSLSAENSIGNCLLLKSSFNISKGKDELQTFLNKVHEFRFEEVDVDQWCDALGITNELRRPTNNPIQLVTAAVTVRRDAIRTELVQYVEGGKERRDWGAIKVDENRSSTDGKGRRSEYEGLANLITDASALLTINDRSFQALLPWTT